MDNKKAQYKTVDEYVKLWPKEVQALRKSGQVLRQTIDTVLARVGAAR